MKAGSTGFAHAAPTAPTPDAIEGWPGETFVWTGLMSRRPGGHATGAATVSVGGRVALAGGPEQPCRAEVATPESFLIATAASGRRGQEALCRLDYVGLIPGWVGPALADGFTLIPDLCEVRRERVAARLAWLGDQRRNGPERRGTPRIVPLYRHVAVRLPDGVVAEGEIEDLSKSGARIRFAPVAGVSLPWAPGLQVTVGKRYAAVVRAEGQSIAVRFRLPFTDETFNPSVVL